MIKYSYPLGIGWLLLIGGFLSDDKCTTIIFSTAALVCFISVMLSIIKD